MRKQNKKHRTVRKTKAGPNFTGQHLLHNPRTIRMLMDTANIQQTDIVLEIGAGKGNLTFPIAEKACKVIAVEIDTDFVQVLRKDLRKKEYKIRACYYGTCFSRSTWG